MKFLQDLVPGCSKVHNPSTATMCKSTPSASLSLVENSRSSSFYWHGLCIVCCSQVTGKAVMLDEIINYVQSLQRQIEVSTRIVALPLIQNWIFAAVFGVWLWPDDLLHNVYAQFLSMKLAAVDPRLDSNLEALLSKEVRNCLVCSWCLLGESFVS